MNIEINTGTAVSSLRKQNTETDQGLANVAALTGVVLKHVPRQEAQLKAAVCANNSTQRRLDRTLQIDRDYQVNKKIKQ